MKITHQFTVKKKALKILALALIIALVLSLALAMGSYISPLVFWGFAAATAFFAFIVLPRINK